MTMIGHLLSFLLHLLYLYHSTKSNSLYLLRTRKLDYCVTDQSSGMYVTDYNGSIFEEEKIESLTDFAYPDNNWKLVSSLDYDGLPVFDQRWTNLPTESITRLDPEKRQMLLHRLSKTFSGDKNYIEKVTFSLRANEFEFYLCDSEDVANAFCYWFLIGFNNAVFYRICINQITVIEKQEPSDPCNRRYAEQQFSHLSEEKWSHIILERNEDTFSLKHIDNGNETNIFELSNVKSQKMRYLLIHTKDDIAFYKLHEYKYLRTIHSKSIEMKKSLKVRGGKVCFSLFYTTCPHCEIKIYLIDIKEGIRTTISSNETLPPSFGTWKQSKLQFSPHKHLSLSHAYVALAGHSTNPNKLNQFWAIDSFRECQKSDYRKSSKRGSLKSCHLVSNWSDKVEWTDSDEKITCQWPNEFGESCIVCNMTEQLEITGALLGVCERTNGRQHCCKFKGEKGRTASALTNLLVRWNKNNTIVLDWSCPKIDGCTATNFQIKIFENVNKSSYLLQDYKCEEMCFHKVNKTFPSSTQLNIEISAIIDEQKLFIAATEYSYPEIPELVNHTITIIDEQKKTIRFQLNTTENYQRKPITSKYLFILIADINKIIPDRNLVSLENILNETGKLTCCFTVIAEINLLNDKSQLLDYIIGSGSSVRSHLLNETLHNYPLKKRPSEIKILLTNEYKKKYRFKLYSHSLQKLESSPVDHTKDENFSGKAVLAISLTLFGVCVTGIFIIMMFIIYKRKTDRENSDFIFMMTNEFNEGEEEEVGSRNLSPDKRATDAKLTEGLLETRNFPKHSEIIQTKSIQLSEFEEYVKRSLEYKELERQHGLFPRGHTKPCKYGSLDANKHKNRYENLITYDHSRVVLEKVADDNYSDYINASYIHGYKVTNAYIATQGPKKETMEDFWRMIWQENVNNIVMIGSTFEDGKEKIHQYWPSKGGMTCGSLSVQTQSITEFTEFEQRVFNLTRDYETRRVEQIHFTAWPDPGIPLYPHTLRTFVEKIVTIPLSSTSPVVVHCSAGVGRTGTILLIDVCLRMAAEEGTVDFLNSLQKLRQQRPNMVDNEEQYKLAHLVVLDYHFGLRTSIPCDKFDQQLEEILKVTDGLKTQMEYLRNSEWQDEAMKSVVEVADSYIIPQKKNRFGNIVPERLRIELSRYPSDDPSSSYINAVRVDGVKCREKFIVTQQPMPNTLGDFWRLILEMRSEIIISLNEVNLDDETCCKFWPTAEEPEIHPVDFINVVFKKRVRFTHYDIYSLNLCSKQVRSMEVTVISLKGWKARTNIPFSCDDFFSFWQDADSLSRNFRNIIITCFDGATASGVYVALSSVIEKMKLEKQCDVCTAVRIVRHNRKQFVRDENQLIFLYGAALIYNIKCFSHNTN